MRLTSATIQPVSESFSRTIYNHLDKDETSTRFARYYGTRMDQPMSTSLRYGQGARDFFARVRQERACVGSRAVRAVPYHRRVDMYE